MTPNLKLEGFQISCRPQGSKDEEAPAKQQGTRWRRAKVQLLLQADCVEQLMSVSFAKGVTSHYDLIIPLIHLMLKLLKN